MRYDGRTPTELRTITITPNVSEYAEGSCLIEFGKTKVLCTASYEQPGPKWIQGSGGGWVTAEYGMLPRSTHDRIKRERSLQSGRTQEISRLIGRSLRSCLSLKMLPDCQIMVDCDVLTADGGTRTASITGGFVALGLAVHKLMTVGEIKESPFIHYVSAVSVGLHQGQVLLDLNYEEDSSIATDMNFVMGPEGRLIEVQGTAEQGCFSRQELNLMLDLAESGCETLFKKQASILGEFFPWKLSQ
jgi:ribonuclease PH